MLTMPLLLKVAPALRLALTPDPWLWKRLLRRRRVQRLLDQQIHRPAGARMAHVVGGLDEAEGDQVDAEVEAELGPIDVLINNAGITRDGFFHKMSHDQWSDVIRVNMDSVFNMTRQVINGMRDRGHGRIVNISSINGQKGQIGQTNYSAAKAGMIGFTKALALENARKGVTVNCIAPGYIDTEMVGAMDPKVLESIVSQIPVGRLGKGEEIADMVSWLVGERAGYVTGCTLSLNGGQYLVG